MNWPSIHFTILFSLSLFLFFLINCILSINKQKTSTGTIKPTRIWDDIRKIELITTKGTSNTNWQLCNSSSITCCTNPQNLQLGINLPSSKLLLIVVWKAQPACAPFESRQSKQAFASLSIHFTQQRNPNDFDFETEHANNILSTIFSIIPFFQRVKPKSKITSSRLKY